MADSEEIKKIKKQLEDLKKSLDDVSKRSIDRILKSFTEGGASLNEWRQQLEFFQDEADSVSDSLNYISKSLSSSVSELRQGNEELRKQANATKKLSSIADQLLAIRKGDASFDKKKIDKLKDEVKLRLQILKSSRSQYEENSAGYNALQNDIDAANELLGTFEGIESTSEKINKELGVLPSLAGGIDKALKKIGLPSLGIADAVDETQKLGQEAARVGDKGFNPMSTLTKKIGGNISSMATKANLLQLAITLLVEALIKSDKEAGEMAKSMNMTYEDALSTRRELGNIAALSGDAALNVRALQESYIAIGQSLGSNAKADKETLKTFTKLREQAGYTNEQLAELNKLSLVNGKSLEDNTKEILGGAKAYASRKSLVINEKQVLNDVVKASASLKLSLSGSADALAKSAVQARAVGLNLEQAATMADQLLQFETSIENELSAELLTGKDLNFEKARTLALNNDIAGAAEEIANQVGSSADFAKMNAIQQEAIAKAAGLTKDQLAQSLMDREALAKLSGVEGKDAKEKFDNLVKQVGMEEAKKRLGNDQLANQFKQQSIQERFNQAVEKLQEMFVQIAEPILQIVSPLVDLVTTILPAISFIMQPTINAFKALGDVIKTFIMEPLKGAKEMFDGIMDIFKGDFESGFKKFGTGLLRAILSPIQAVMNGVTTLLNGGIDMLNSVTGLSVGKVPSLNLTDALTGNDVLSPGGSSSGYGNRTLFGPEGAIKLNNKDTVIAGTKLFDQADDMISQPGGSSQIPNGNNPNKNILSVSNQTAPPPASPDSNALLIAEMKRGNDQREEQLRLQKQNTFVSTIRVQ
jgi:hypothetical protein